MDDPLDRWGDVASGLPDYLNDNEDEEVEEERDNKNERTDYKDSQVDLRTKEGTPKSPDSDLEEGVTIWGQRRWKE